MQEELKKEIDKIMDTVRDRSELKTALLSLFTSKMEEIVKKTKPDYVKYDAPISVMNAVDTYEQSVLDALEKRE
jgi:hypothetical protein